MSLTKQMTLTLLESEETKQYVASGVSLDVPTLVNAGLGLAVPFLSPLIIAASSYLTTKAFKLAGDKIEIAYDQIQQYKEDKGIKGFLAKLASPSLGVLKKVFPVSEKHYLRY
jgi:hypothetical protein